jgi:hypothetical protein
VNRHEVVSPGELHTYVLDLPSLPRDRIPGAIRTRLRILHPGDPDDAAVDFHRNGDSPLSYLVFVAERAVAERYAGTGPAALPPFRSSHPSRKRGEPQNISLFWADGWIEAARMAGPRVEAVESAPAGHDAGETIRSLRDTLFEKAGPGDGIPPSVPAKLFYLRNVRRPWAHGRRVGAAGVAEATTIEVDAAKVGRLSANTSSSPPLHAAGRF